MAKTSNNTRHVMRVAMFVALSLIMFMVESLLPPLLAFAPGAKIGLANVVSLCALVLLGVFQAYAVVIIRNLLVTIIVGNPSALIYSMPAGLASLTVMVVLYLFLVPKVSLMFVSLIAAIVFNVVQLFIASIVVGNFSVMIILPLTLIASLLAGIFVGLVAYYVVKHLPMSVYS